MKSSSRYKPRPKYNDWLSYDQAKLLIQHARNPPKSRVEYLKWHDQNNPLGIPKRPSRVYDNWVGWGDFLGTGNVWVPMCKADVSLYRGYWDAQRYIHSLNLSTIGEYKEHVLSKGLPTDIPRHPQRIYKEEWVDWPSWLGVTVRSRVINMENVKQCVALCTMDSMASNVLKVVICKHGVDELKEVLEEAGNMRVYKMYKWDPSDHEKFVGVMEMYANNQGNNEWLCQNTHSLTFELDNILAWWS